MIFWLLWYTLNGLWEKLYNQLKFLKVIAIIVTYILKRSRFLELDTMKHLKGDVNLNLNTKDSASDHLIRPEHR